jgi:hypothetical protein
MNRHIVPSMLLSVLIVCFFAVILFESDTSRKKLRGVTGKKTGVEHVNSAPHGTSAKPVEPRPVDTKQKPVEEERKPAQGERKATAEATASPVQQGGAAASSPPAPSRASARNEPAAEPEVLAQPPASNSTRPTTPPAKAGTTRSPGPTVADTPPVTKRASEPTPEFGPQQAFTAVRQGESLRDVAIRVYGSVDELDSLWRANRDVLPRKDSALTAGSVLRTPTKTPGD